jgi:Flp pilus assembly protein TadD
LVLFWKRQQDTIEDAAQRIAARLERAPRDAHAHAQLGHLLLQAGDPRGAEEALRDALAIDRGIEGFHIGLAAALEAQGDTHAALAVTHALITSSSTRADSHAHYGHLLAMTRNYTGAVRALRKAIALDPETERYHRMLAGILDNAGRSDEGDAVRAALAQRRRGGPSRIRLFARAKALFRIV